MLTDARRAANYKVIREWVEALLEGAREAVDKDPGHEWARGKRDILQAQLDLMDELDS